MVHVKSVFVTNVPSKKFPKVFVSVSTTSNGEWLVLLQGEAPYFKDRWCQFDGIMVLCLYTSFVLQGFEFAKVNNYNDMSFELAA